jgi:hypothetical protein
MLTSDNSAYCAAGGSVTLTAAVSPSTGSYLYDWYLNGAPIPGYTGISNNTYI